VDAPGAAAEDKPLDRLWDVLNGQDAGQAYEAAWATAWIAERLRPASPLTAEKVGRLIDDLDASDFDRREAASKELAALGGQVEPALRLKGVGRAGRPGRTRPP